MVVKKEHTPEKPAIKMAVDLRKVNASTIPDSGGLGTMDQILARLYGKKCLTALDCAGGYYQVGLAMDG